MKKLKILILMLFIFLLTGCTGKYNLRINNDLSVDESLNLEIKNGNYEKTVNIFKENKINKNKYTVSITGDSIIINYKEKFKSLDDYILYSKVYHQLVDEIQYTKNKKFIDLYVDEKLKLKNKDEDILIGNINDIDNIDINIELPFKVLNSNADNINDNTYTWSINKNIVNQKMFLKFNQNRSSRLSMQLTVFVVIIISAAIIGVIILKNYKDKHKI